MNAKKYKSTGSETLDREVTPFDLLDRWGRWVGYTFEIRAVAFTATDKARTAALSLVIPGAFSGTLPESLPWDG